MKLLNLPFLGWIFRTQNSTNTQSSGINGDGNSVDQSVTNNYIFAGPVDDQANTTTRSQTLAESNSSRQLKRSLNASTLAQAARNTDKPVTIFLAGPYIEPEKEAESKGSAASFLRFQLFHRLKGENFSVSLGIYPDLLGTFEAENGDYHNAAEAELRHAKDVASLVVMIPGSPGSFAEIGAFSLKKDICAKMIILADITHEKSLGYLNNGPVACAKALGSSVKNVDYSDVESCFEIVRVFSSEIRTRIQLQSRLEG